MDFREDLWFDESQIRGAESNHLMGGGKKSAPARRGALWDFVALHGTQKTTEERRD